MKLKPTLPDLEVHARLTLVVCRHIQHYRRRGIDPVTVCGRRITDAWRVVGLVDRGMLPPTSSFASPGLCSDCNRMKDSTAAG